jgi:hypothetical protein
MRPVGDSAERRDPATGNSDIRALSRVVAAVLGAAVFFSSSFAHAATVLLSIADAPTQTGTPYEVSFTTTSTSATIEFSGYQKFAYEYVSEISVTLNGGPNLLGDAWAKTPAAFGSDARTVYDGTSVPGLWFGGFVPGYYDSFSQTLTTTPGADYVIHFSFSNRLISAPQSFGLFSTLEAPALPSSSLLVATSTGRLVPSVPELSTWAMILIGLGGLGLAGYRRQPRSLGRRPL